MAIMYGFLSSIELHNVRPENLRDFICVPVWVVLPKFVDVGYVE